MLAFDFADQMSGEQQAVFDLAWPNGIQEELSQPVALLLSENTEQWRSPVGPDSGVSPPYGLSKTTWERKS